MAALRTPKRASCFIGISHLWPVTIEEAPLTREGFVNWVEVEERVLDDAVEAIKKEIATMSKSDLRDVLRIADCREC